MKLIYSITIIEPTINNSKDCPINYLDKDNHACCDKCKHHVIKEYKTNFVFYKKEIYCNYKSLLHKLNKIDELL